jgi:hypothetical protein
MCNQRYKVTGIRCKVGFGLRVAGCVLRVAGLLSAYKKMNIEHRTSNIQPRILLVSILYIVLSDTEFTDYMDSFKAFNPINP